MEIPRHWRLRKQRYGLEGDEYRNEVSFPPGPYRPRYNKETGKLVAASNSGGFEEYNASRHQEAPVNEPV